MGGLRLVRNRLVASAAGTIQAQPTEQFEDLTAGLVFRSVGYRGVPLPGVPFDEKWGVVLNEKGRVLDSVSLLEFATFLETLCGIEIPPEDITEENFDSIEGVVRYLRARGRVAEAAG